MAILTGQNIGANQRGILNLGSTINTPLDATLRNVTDGMGNNSLLKLSTTELRIDSGVTNRRLTFGSNGQMTFVNDNDFIIDYTTGSANIFRLAYSGTNVKFNSDGYQFANYAAGTVYANLQSAGLSIGLGVTAPSARLHVRGDGTNPIGRFESNAGANFLLINNSGQSLFGSAGANEPYLVNYNGTSTESGSGQSLRIRQRANTGSTGNTLIQYWADGLFSGTTSGTAVSHEFLSSGFLGSSAGSANYRNATFAYTINNSGAQTGTATGIFLNATETALNGMTHNLLDLQVGGVSKFRVSNNGTLTIPNNNIIVSNGYISSSQLYALTIGKVGNYFIDSASDGVVRISDNAQTSFGRLQLGGTTNAFPAIKRNGAAMQIVLADDSGFANIRCADLNSTSISNSSTGVVNINAVQYVSTSGVSINNASLNASAILQADSTTKGFLPPRMTTTEVNAIASPAEGLVVFNTTISHLCVYQGGAWVKINHSPM